MTGQVRKDREKRRLILVGEIRRSPAMGTVCFFRADKKYMTFGFTQPAWYFTALDDEAETKLSVIVRSVPSVPVHLDRMDQSTPTKRKTGRRR